MSFTYSKTIRFVFQTILAQIIVRFVSLYIYVHLVAEYAGVLLLCVECVLEIALMITVINDIHNKQEKKRNFNCVFGRNDKTIFFSLISLHDRFGPQGKNKFFTAAVVTTKKKEKYI